MTNNKRFSVVMLRNRIEKFERKLI